METGSNPSRTDMDKRHALDEFLNDYQQNDVIKAKVIIDYLPEIESGEKRRILFELFKLEDAFAIPVLAYLEHKHPALIEELPQIHENLLERALGNPGFVLKGLVTIIPESAVYIELVATIGLKEALPRLRQFLSITDNNRILEATIHAMGALGDNHAVAAIGEFLASDNIGLQTAAIKALGNIGTNDALNLLFNALEKLPEVSASVLELFRELQNDQSIRLLNQTLTSSNAEIRIMGKAKLFELGEKAVPILTANLQSNHPDLQIHTLNILQEIGDQSAVKAVRHLLNSEPENDNVRFAAFETLASLPNFKGDYLLATGLTDRDDSIRLAAAKAIEKNLDSTMTGGIRNMVKNENADAVRTIKAIIDAEAGELFSHLLDVPFFQKISIEYIATKAHKDVRRYYLEVLTNKGHSELVAYIQQKSAALNLKQERKQICAVDDSVMILSVYRRVLNELGYEPILFEFPEECLFWLAENKPVAVFTDLNMPKVSGIELSRRIREQYDSASLPIVMVTTQQDGKDDSELQRIGINKIMSKPFDSDTVKQALFELAVIDG